MVFMVAKVLNSRSCQPLDANGILKVTATNSETGNQNSITLSSSISSNLSTAEVEALIQSAEAKRSADQKEESRVIARLELEYLCADLLKMSGVSPDVMAMARESQTWLSNNTAASEHVSAGSVGKLGHF